MPLPAGFIEEQTLKYSKEEAGVKMPTGFVEENKTIPELRAAPDKALFNKVRSFFTDETKLVARAQNIYALSEVTGLPLREVNKNYDMLRRSSQVTGINPDVDNKELLQMLLLPAIGVSATINPIGTAAGLIAFGALDAAIPTDKLLKTMEEQGIDDDVIKTIDLVDFVGKSLIVGGVFKKAPQMGEMFLKKKVVKYKLPETVSLTSEQVRDIWQTEKLTTPEQKSLFAALELNSFDRRAAIEHGININIPSEKIVKITDNPLWARAKNLFGKSEAAPEMSVTKTGQPTKAPIGAIAETKAASPAPKENPVAKVISALKEAKDVRAKQETLYAEERSKKFAKLKAAGERVQGEKGYFAKLGALKGELPKVEFESIRGKVSQEDIDALFISIQESPKIGEWEKISAAHGLSKMFGESGGRVPTEGELLLLNEVFGKEFAEAVLEKRSLFQKMFQAGLQIANIPRSLMASYDLSAPFRQGIFFIGRPKQFLPAFQKMFAAFTSEGAYQGLQDAIITHGDYQLSRDSGLALTDVDVLLGNREESFMSSWAEKIPFLGKGVKASSRAYIGFLNKLRFDVFADLINKAEGLGLKPRKDRDLSKAIADFINNATGRGTIPFGLQRAAVTLNSIFFSPRLIASRLNLLNPMYYIKQHPFVRKEALKSLFSFLGIGLTTLALGKMAGAEVGGEPRSSDFGKIKIGHTRIDVWGGFQPLVRASAQIMSGKYISSTTGKELTLGEGYKPLTRADIVQRFVEGKLAPIPSFVVSLMKQQSAIGEPVNVPEEAVKRLAPMVMQDIFELAQEDPKLIPLSVLSAFGIGVQTYKGKKKWRL